MNKSVILTVENKYSATDECVCCNGKHLFATHLRTGDGGLYYVGELVRDVAKHLPNGSKIKVTVEVGSTTEVGKEPKCPPVS